MPAEQEFPRHRLVAAHVEFEPQPVAAPRCVVRASSCWRQVADRASASYAGLASLAEPAAELAGCHSFAPVERDYRPSELEHRWRPWRSQEPAWASVLDPALPRLPQQQQLQQQVDWERPLG